MSREAKLRACLDVALQKWSGYSNNERVLEGSSYIEDGKDGEAELYRMCVAVLINASDKEKA